MGISPESADKLSSASKAIITLAGKEVSVPIIGVSPSADERSGMVLVTTQLPPITYRNNQSLAVKLPLDAARGEDNLFLSLDAVTIGSTESFVFVAKDNKAEKRLVEIGEVFNDRIEIKSGIDKNDLIIIEGARGLIDQQSIQII